MALSEPRSIFGIHSFSPYDRDTGEFFGTLKVLENSSIALNAEIIELLGGSNKFPFSSEVGSMTAEMSLSFSEYPDFVFELFAGNAPTSSSAEATGSVTAILNKKGTSVVDATTGIASIAAKAGDESDLKFGKYVVKAVSATTIDLFLSSDADIGRGTNGTYQNDLLKVNATPITIPGTGATVDETTFGLEFTGGSGTVLMVVGDTATFEVKPINNDSMDVTIGQQADQLFPFFGAILMAAKQSNQEMVEIDALKCLAAGLPLGFARNTYSPAEVTVKLLYDSALDGVFKVRHVSPS